LIGCAALLCLMALAVGCGSSKKTGSLAYVSDSTGSGFHVFNANKDGSLSPASPATQSVTTPGDGPKMTVFAPNGNWAYALDVNGTSVLSFSRAGNGVLSAITVTTVQNGPANSLAVSPDNLFLFVALSNSAEIETFQIDQSTGAPAFKGFNSTSYVFTQLAISPTGVMYGLSTASQALAAFTLDGSGTIQQPAAVKFLGTTPSPNGMVVSANGAFVYVLAAATGSCPTSPDCISTQGVVNNISFTATGLSPRIYGFRTGTQCGTGLPATSLCPTPYPSNSASFHENADLVAFSQGTTAQESFPSSPVSGVTSTDNNVLFVVNRGSNNVSMYQIDQTTGALTEITGTAATVGSTTLSNASPYPCGCSQPNFIAISPNDNSYYVLDPTSISPFAFIENFTANARPVSALPPQSIPAGNSPTWITVR
jgi:hypothetical protein